MTFDRITVDPARMNGQPCVRNMRLTVRRVVELAAFYQDREQFLDAAGRVGADSRQDVTQVGERIDPAELATGDQAVDHRRPTVCCWIFCSNRANSICRSGSSFSERRPNRCRLYQSNSVSIVSAVFAPKVIGGDQCLTRW